MAGRGAFNATDSNDIPLAAEAPDEPDDVMRGFLLGLAVVRDRRAHWVHLGGDKVKQKQYRNIKR
jgi:hypothetical protein